MIQYIQIALVLGAIYLIVVGTGFIVDFVPNLINTQIYGPEYCFRDIDKTSIEVVAQGAKFKYTEETGDELCFRTKDKAFVERLNQQIQDRKAKERIAEIEANKEIIKTAIIVFGFIVIAWFIATIWPKRNRYY